MGFLGNMIWTLAIVGVIIFFHELGHFLAAKKLGIKVERFSIGFGPRLIGFTKGDTEYRISWLPFFGGYVKMLGENPAERPGEETSEAEAIPEEGRFDLAPVSHRAIVAVSGPGMNIILAVLMFALAYMAGLPADPDTTISYVEPDSPALAAGIMPGDKILSVNGYKVKTWSDIQENVLTQPGKELEIVLLRNDGERVTLRSTPERVEVPVISISLNLQEKLDNGIIPEDLRQEFGFSKIPLSSDAVISVENAGARWLLTDGDANYSIRKENDMLEVYRGAAEEDMDLVFSVDLALRDGLAIQKDLENGTVPEELERKFAEIGDAISSGASILVEEPESKWLITDKSHSRGIFGWLIPGKDRHYHVRREESKLSVYMETDFGMLGVGHSARAIIRDLGSDSPVARAGLRIGDAVEAVEGKAVIYESDFLRELQDISGESVVLTVRRDGNAIDVSVPLEYDENDRLVSFRSLSFEEMVRRDPVTAFRMAVPETIRMGGKVFQFLKRMVIGDVSLKYVAGPVGIVQIVLAVVKTGVASTLRFAGFLSVNLGIVNLLPLFITDGAMILFLTIEKVRRKPMDRKRQLIIQQIGIGFIIIFFLLVTYNDIIRLFTGGL